MSRTSLAILITLATITGGSAQMVRVPVAPYVPPVVVPPTLPNATLNQPTLVVPPPPPPLEAFRPEAHHAPDCDDQKRSEGRC